MSTLTLGSVYTTAPVYNTVQELGEVVGVVTVVVEAGAYITATAEGASAWTFTVADSIAAGMSFEWTVQLTNGANQTFAALINGSSSNVKWPGGSAPPLTSSGTDILRFVKGAGNYVVGYRLATDVS